MKIKHYPGKAVDASLSLESNSAMGALYEANWLQAASAVPPTTGGVSATVTVPDSAPAPLRSLNRQPSNAGSFLLDGISVLSKYQMTLEKIRQLELEQAREKRGVVHTMKELNGYRPSALQHHKQQLHNGWVDEEQPEEVDVEEKKSTAPAPASSVNHYVLDPTERPRLPRPRQQVSVKPPSLRRSQTMLQQMPPSYVTLRAPKVKNNSSSSSVWEQQPQRVICQQPQRLLPPPTEPPPAPPTQGAKQRAASSNGNSSKPLSRSQTSVQRYATIRMPHHSTSLCRATVPRAPASAPAVPAAPVRRHSLEQALQGLRLEDEEQRRTHQHISPTASSNGSSKDLNGEGFCIPRPRLIVPVHTYARRRRTGNLKEQSTTQQEEEETENNSGKSRWGVAWVYVDGVWKGNLMLKWEWEGVREFRFANSKVINDKSEND